MTIEIIDDSFEASDWEQSIFEIDRNPTGIWESRNVELHIFTNSGKILTGEIPKKSRFCKLHHQLLTCENIKHQSTTMRTVVYPSGNCEFKFTEERSNYRRIKDKTELENLLEKVRIQKGANLQRLSTEEAELMVKEIIEKENSNFPISDNLISIILERKGYILLKTEIEKIRSLYKIPYYERRKKIG